MANSEHLANLKYALDRKDISLWNIWRYEYSDIVPDLHFADLHSTDLRNVSLHLAYLRQADLHFADLHSADLSFADLLGANLLETSLQSAILCDAILREADLRSADLRSADLRFADLRQADLREANLFSVNLGAADISYADLRLVDLSYADLRAANFDGTNLSEANLAYARINNTTFSNVDLSTIKNLDQSQIDGPCEISISTLYKSQAVLGKKWFLDFLERSGVPETMRIFARSLVVKPIDYYSCFISYSSKDEEFCQEFQSRLKQSGLRVWFAPEEMKGGQKIHEQIYEAIRYHDKLILVLSEHSMNSDWVKLEIIRARKREKAEKRRVLFPIRLLPYETLQSWELITSEGEDLAEEIRQFYIPDFTDWKNLDVFKQEVDRLIRALQAEDS